MAPAGRHARAGAAGLRAERLAGWLLRLKGFRILARRYRASGGEIDLVARRGRLVIFVEVKARAALGDAREAISADKKRRLGRAIRHWIGGNPDIAGCVLRCDAVFVGTAGLGALRWPRHIADVLTIDPNGS